MSRTSARDFVEALLLDVHHAQYLQAHPHIYVKDSILQDQLLGDAETAIRRHGDAATLARLHQEARQLNLEASRGRIKSDWIEPETLFWAAWKVLPAGEKAAIACEAVTGFVERVAQAATMDPRPEFQHDPMEWHRHRIHPELWKALEAVGTPLTQPIRLEKAGQGNGHDPAGRELAAWQTKKDAYLARRPIFSQAGLTPPWEQG